MEHQALRTVYRRTERMTLILLLLALPVFGVVYLYHNSGNLDWGLPELSGVFHFLLTGVTTGLLIAQYVLFHRRIKVGRKKQSLEEKVKVYCLATEVRFLILFAVAVLSTIGLLFHQGAIYVVLFAVDLVFFSLAKPSPDRIGRLMRLKKDELTILREISRPE